MIPVTQYEIVVSFEIKAMYLDTTLQTLKQTYIIQQPTSNKTYTIRQEIKTLQNRLFHLCCCQQPRARSTATNQTISISLCILQQQMPKTPKLTHGGGSGAVGCALHLRSDMVAPETHNVASKQTTTSGGYPHHLEELVSSYLVQKSLPFNQKIMCPV
ncbi:hypothetical protein J1614_008152 [Plenodomus biglobosus]|nr:hypothetical protein J1614_008152 [Plenodomus biglobosus]